MDLCRLDDVLPSFLSVNASLCQDPSLMSPLQLWRPIPVYIRRPSHDNKVLVSFLKGSLVFPGPQPFEDGTVDFSFFPPPFFYPEPNLARVTKYEAKRPFGPRIYAGLTL